LERFYAADKILSRILVFIWDSCKCTFVTLTMFNKIWSRRKEGNPSGPVSWNSRSQRIGGGDNGPGAHVRQARPQESGIAGNRTSLQKAISEAAVQNSTNSMKKASEPNMRARRFSGVAMLIKSNSQPVLLFARESPTRHGSKSKRKAKDKDNSEGGGFLDRAFENAASLSFEDEEEEDENMETKRPESH